jgi:sphingomyelin phosphodiesterase 2
VPVDKSFKKRRLSFAWINTSFRVLLDLLIICEVEGTDIMTTLMLPTSHDRDTPSNYNKNNDDTSIRILTFNVWGLKYISKFRTQRITHVAKSISTSTAPPDIICLQELFTYGDYLLLRRLTRSTLSYGKFYHSGIFGGGLVVLSRWKIVESRMVRYALNGRPSAFWRGDWFVGKGVACAKIELPRTFWASDAQGSADGAVREERKVKRERYLEVFNTHLHAPYDEGEPGKDTYSCHRVAQAWEIAGLMRRAIERESLVLGCGDFNMVVGGLEWRVLQAHARGFLRDVWREVHPVSSVGAWIDECEKKRLEALGPPDGVGGPPSVRESMATHGHTCDSVTNTWRWSQADQKALLKQGRDRTISPDEKDPRAKRLDYIFLGDGTDQWVVKGARMCMMERHPELKCSLSDHFGVEAEILRTEPSSSSPPREQHHHTTTDTPIEQDLYPSIIDLIQRYTLRCRLHRRRRLLHFLLSVLITLACFVAIWFSPTNYVSFLLLVLSSLGLMAGTVDGLIGGLFGGSELRALKEWEWDVRCAARIGRGGNGEEGEMRDGGGGERQEEEEEEKEEEEEQEEMGRVKDWWD